MRSVKRDVDVLVFPANSKIWMFCKPLVVINRKAISLLCSMKGECRVELFL